LSGNPLPWTVDAWLRSAATRLGDAGIEDPRVEARLLLTLASGISRARQMAEPGAAIERAVIERLHGFLERRCRREPLAYVRGTAPFWDVDMVVRPGVLIPRPETEILVEAVVARAGEGGASRRILDLGIGSGCIALTLLRLMPAATAVGVDLSSAALDCAAENARRLGVAARLTLVGGDWADAPAGSYDLVVANPPYVAREELHRLQPEVRDFEPGLALCGGHDGLDSYRAILPLAAGRLARDGLLALEHGAGQGDAIAGLARAAGFATVERWRDLAGIERCILGGLA
jgi:release factor glutamine methyltransferase